MPDPLTRPSLLRAAAAREWLRQRGGDFDHDPAFTLIGHEAVTADVRLWRIWHTSGCVRLEPDAWGDPAAVLLVLPLEGAMTVALGGGRAIVGRGSFAALPTGSAASISTSGSTARLSLLVRSSAPPSGLVVSSSSALGVLTAAANAILEAPPVPSDPAVPGLRTALQGLATAVLAE